MKGNSFKFNDIMTGEKLEIIFDKELDIIEINGNKVIRKRALESDKDQFVFGSCDEGDLKIYHLNKDQVSKMKSM